MEKLSLRKQRIYDLLKGIETGDPAATEVVNPDRYVQHNPHTKEGDEGLAELFQRLAKTNPRVELLRVFEDGDFVFAHTEYDFSSTKICFEVFRYDGEQVVEHWDNLQAVAGPNVSGHSMIDGHVEIGDLELTEANRELVAAYSKEVLINRDFGKFESYTDAAQFNQHNPHLSDDLDSLAASLSDDASSPLQLEYDQVHRVLAEGNFVLVASEGRANGVHSAIYDLYRIQNGLIVEHWDTIEAIPPRDTWENENGKF